SPTRGAAAATPAAGRPRARGGSAPPLPAAIARPPLDVRRKRLAGRPGPPPVLAVWSIRRSSLAVQTHACQEPPADGINGQDRLWSPRARPTTARSSGLSVKERRSISGSSTTFVADPRSSPPCARWPGDLAPQPGLSAV